MVEKDREGHAFMASGQRDKVVEIGTVPLK